MTKQTLLVLDYLNSGKTFDDLWEDHHVNASIIGLNGKVSLNYDQIEAKNEDELAQQCRGLIIRNVDGIYKAVAVPFYRFFNYGQGSAAIKTQKELIENLIFEKADGCFLYKTMILCWDGSRISIGDIVTKKLTPTLVGMDENGNYVPCEINNWFKNGTKSNWIELELDFKSKGQNKKIKVTSNHHIFINDNYIPAGNIKIGDSVNTIKKVLDENCIHFIESSMLGDGSLTKNGINFKYEESHKQEHLQYTEYVAKSLGEAYSNSSKRISGYGSKINCVSSIPNESISQLRKKWYPNGIKKIPEDLSWIDDFSVAKWYMDDGSLSHSVGQKDRAIFSTHAFEKDDVERLAKKLQEMYGVKTSVEYSRGWLLRVNAGKNNEISQMWERIGKYIVPCMKYKLPLEYRNKDFIEYPSGKILKVVKKSKVLSISKVENTKENFPAGRQGYDISTTTKNYIAENILVHNSLGIVYYDEFDKRWHVGTRSVPDANVLHSSNLTFRQIFEECALQSVESIEVFFNSLNKELTYMFEICSPINMNVVEYQTPHIVLLGARNTKTLQEIHLDELSVPNIVKAKMHKFNSYQEFTDFVEGRPASEGEGVVVLTKDFQRVKVKSLNYVNAHHLASCVGSSPRNMLSVVLNKQEDDVEPILSPYIFGKIKAFKDGFTLLADDIRLARKQVEEATSDRKSYALYVKEHFPHYENFLFGLLRYNSLDELIQANKKDGNFTNGFLDNIIRLIEEKKWEGTNN